MRFSILFDRPSDLTSNLEAGHLSPVFLRRNLQQAFCRQWRWRDVQKKKKTSHGATSVNGSWIHECCLFFTLVDRTPNSLGPSGSWISCCSTFSFPLPSAHEFLHVRARVCVFVDVYTQTSSFQVVFFLSLNVVPYLSNCEDPRIDTSSTWFRVLCIVSVVACVLRLCILTLLYTVADDSDHDHRVHRSLFQGVSESVVWFGSHGESSVA